MYTYSEGLDNNCLHTLYGDDTEYALQMFEIYVDMIEGQIKDLLESAKSVERENVRRLSHKVKPVFTMVGLPQLTTLSEKIEKESESGSEDVMVKNCTELSDKVNATLPVIKHEIEQLKNNS